MRLPILVIDGDPGVCEALCTGLLHEGYRGEAAEDGAQALDMVRQDNYGAAILGVPLRDLDEHTVLSALLESDPTLPVIVLSGFATQEKRIASLLDGAFACLAKPHNLEEVTATLRRAVGVKALAMRAERAEGALTESEERFRLVVQSAPDAVVLADGDGRIISINRAAQRLFSYTEEEVLGAPLTQLMPARYREAHVSGFQRVRASGASQIIGKVVEVHGLRKDNSEFPLELSLATWTINEHAFYSGIMRDISERKEAEERLRAQAAQLQEQARLLDLAHVMIRNLDDEIIFWNKGATKLYGWSKEEAVGKVSHALLQTKAPKPIAQLKAELMGRGCWEGQLEQTKRDGSRIVVASHWELHRGPDGQPLAILEVNNDITRAKRAEKFRRAQLEVGLILSAAETLTEAGPQVLKTACETTGWDLAMIWLVDRQGLVLQREAIWQSPCLTGVEVLGVLDETAWSSDRALPERVWKTGKPAWVSDVIHEVHAPESPAAAKAGFRAAFGVPIGNGNKIDGVLTFWSQTPQKPDRARTELITAIGVKIGQFLERQRQDERLAKINGCFLSFGKDTNENIQRLTALCGELLGSTWAVYSHLDGDLLHSTARWQTPPDFPPVRKPDGLLCAEVIAEGASQPIVIRHLPETPYAGTDLWVLTYHLETFIGQAVMVGGRHAGALCAVFQTDFTPSEGEQRLMGILAAALGVEEERKRAEQTLWRAYEDTEKILSSLPGAVLVVSDDLYVVHANALACEYFGQGRETIVGGLLHQVLPLEQRWWNELTHALKPETIGQHRGEHNPEFELHERVYQYRLFPVSLRGSERGQAGLMIMDITVERQLQDHVMQAEKLASLGTLVSGMAHEVNNPAQGILGMGELILAEDDLGKIKEYARDIIKYSVHVGTVVRNFSSYARPALRDEETPMNLNDRLVEAVKMVQRRPQFGHIQVVSEFQPLPELRARRVEIDQALINIISNAVDAMGGQGQLTLRTLCEDDSLTVLVSDTGSGIPKSLLGRIFDPFFTTKETGKGTGLGLSIVHRIITKHGGTIRVETEEGKGTTFVMRFPLKNC